MDFPRASGILLHVTSLPGRFGIGDLGPEAHCFVDFLKSAGQTYWQILPLGPTGYGDSPYQSFSAFAGNTLLISPESLVEAGLLHDDQIRSRTVLGDERVDFGSAYDWKNKILKIAFDGFQRAANGLRQEFEQFDRENGWWLDDYSLYRALKLFHDHKAWYEWPQPLKLREAGAVHAFREMHSESVLAEKFYQFIFYRQWRLLKEYANDAGIRIIGDIPIFVALDSADVWCNQRLFKLDRDGSPLVVAGVPPDYFSDTGQLWGNPIYDWEMMRQNGFSWWAARVAFALRTVDVMRIDHFRGFSAVWEVPGSDDTAVNGQWVDVPGTELFAALRHHLGELPVFAEDLGVITPEVRELRDANGFPGMKILQYGFAGDAQNHDLPHNFVRNCVAYTGTHDNDTTVGWWKARMGKQSKKKARASNPEIDYCMRYLNTSGAEINWDFIRAIWASVADTAIAPMQDVLGLGNEARMNLPASDSGNWNWRLSKDSLTPDIIGRLRGLTVTYGRNH